MNDAETSHDRRGLLLSLGRWTLWLIGRAILGTANNRDKYPYGEDCECDR